MTRTPDSNTEKLNELYVEREQIEKEITFLQTRHGLLCETYQRITQNITHKESDTEKTIKNRNETLRELFIKKKRYDEVQAEIDKLLDADL